MKKILIALFTFLISQDVDAQFSYSFSVTTQPYTSLTGATSINNTTKWDEENYKVPLGFNFLLNGSSIAHFSIIASNLVTNDTNSTNPVSGFSIMSSDVWDRGNPSGPTSKSPIRYSISGTAPNRIFKAEVFNAGFADEYNNYSTSNDSVNYQVWLYETTNVFEIHFGSSKISHISDYFLPSGKPVFGFMKNLDLNTGSATKVYYLRGNPSSPSVDSTTNLSTLSDGVNSYPIDGTVYRFTPKATRINEIVPVLADIKIYPTICTNSFMIANNELVKMNCLIIDANGKVTYTKTIEVGNNNIDISHLSSGIYIVQVNSNGQSKEMKIVKQ